MNTTLVINGSIVNFVIDGEHTLCFSINGSYKKKHNNDRLAISKWLFLQFEEAKLKYTYILCSPYYGDDEGDMRERIYKKLGFFQSKWGLIWTESGSLPSDFKPIKKEEEESEYSDSFDFDEDE